MPMHDSNVIVLGHFGRVAFGIVAAYAVVTFAACAVVYRRWCRSVRRARPGRTQDA